MELVRLFVGLPTPESYKLGLAKLIGALKPAVPAACSWSRPENWHLTLKFLGDVPADSLGEIDSALKGVAWREFSLKASGGGFFPNIDRPRVMWVGIAAGGSQCFDLASGIDLAFSGLGIEPETRRFTPHLTVARIKTARPGSDWKRAWELLRKAQWPEIQVVKFVLWRSCLGGGGQAGAGPRHVPLGEYGASG